jgi:hypothetical protein
MSPRSGRTENRIISKCLVLLGLHADSCEATAKAGHVNQLHGELGKAEFGSSGRTRTYNPSVNSPRNLLFLHPARRCYLL